ncbi:MAG: hypothetical protein M0C28_42165 [Candidatus Moduliflexus flocculans]|nr:hypothetical protein [Candidatus Moduliflexus flocculans]
MFAAIGHQALVTQARPYDVFRKTLHPALAFAWGARRPGGLDHLAVPPIRPGHERRPRHLRRGRARRAAGAHRPGPPRRRRRRSAGATGSGSRRAVRPLRARPRSTSSCSWPCSSSSSWSRRASTSGPCSRGSSASTSRATARA